MTAALRPSWLFHVALACAAVVCVLLAGTSRAEEPQLPTQVPTQPLAQAASRQSGSSRFRVESVERALAVNHDAPIDRASTLLAPTTRAAWQRGGSRRTQRTSSSQISGVERAISPLGGIAFDRSGAVPAVARLSVHRRDGRRGSAPTRAPPVHR
jgi:hypothetical protein